MFLNLVHKPLIAEPYEYQRKCAHELGLKVTQLISTNLLENDAVIELAKADLRDYGDQIGLLLNPMNDMPQTQVWLLSEADKLRTVQYSVNKFKEKFGHFPTVVANYLMDSHLIRIIKENCPDVKACIAGCFEEGVKVFHGCNNSWYLFSEGMSWNPWYPSKDQSMRPAESEEDWSGVVALPHLSRDFVLSYEGRNDFFASHPGNIQRALANEGYIHEYDYNLCDQHRMQEDYNDGFSYYQINVSPWWLHNSINIIDPDEITRSLYRETLEYMVKLRDEGALQDMYIEEFADYYKKNVPIGHTEVAVGKDILYDSGKHYFWLCNPDYRVLVDTFQGGSIGDLRPYVGKYESFTGVDSPSLVMNSYPYLIQSQYRSGTKHHCFDGSRTTVFVKHGDESLDMCYYPTKVADVKRTDSESTLTLTPVTMKFKDGLEIKLQTSMHFTRGGNIEIKRSLLESSDPNAVIELQEYVKACYGFTEYPENMKGIELGIDGKKVHTYDYSAKNFTECGASEVSAAIPAINTEIALAAVGKSCKSVEVEDGHLFTPYYVLKLNYAMSANEKEITSCLKLRKI